VRAEELDFAEDTAVKHTKSDLPILHGAKIQVSLGTSLSYPGLKHGNPVLIVDGSARIKLGPDLLHDASCACILRRGFSESLCLVHILG
jgi:hypothetical protein